MRPRKRLDIRIAAEVRDTLDQQADTKGQMLTAIVERYILEGIARDQGEVVEASTLPAIRAAVREEVAKQMEEASRALARDIGEHLRRADNRLAAISAKGARSAGIAWRLIYAFLWKRETPEWTRSAYEDAKAKSGKELASHEQIPGV